MTPDETPAPTENQYAITITAAGYVSQGTAPDEGETP